MAMIRTLTDADFAAVHTAFNDAFSDYVVKFSLTPEQLREMMTRRGWVPEQSVAAFDGDRIVAFVLNCRDGDAAYNSGTGVVPSHRRAHLGRKVMEEAIARVREAGATRYVLEVIESNEPAVALYRGLGFQETRRLQVWMYDPPEVWDRHSCLSAVAQTGMSAPHAAAFRDVEPSWQNSDASIRRARDPHVILGDGRGYAIVFPSNGDLPQLAVRRDARRKGLGTRLLDAAAARAGKPLRILNVDDRDEGIAAFLEARGARRAVRQIEMALSPRR